MFVQILNGALGYADIVCVISAKQAGEANLEIGKAEVNTIDGFNFFGGI